MLKLQKFSEPDGALFKKLAFNEPVMRANMGRTFTEEEAEWFFGMILEINRADSEFGYYKVFLETEDADVYIGMGALTPNEEEQGLEVEYMLLPDYWHQGYGTELLVLLMEKARQQDPGAELVGIVDPENVYSKRMLSRQGFAFVREFVNSDGGLAQVYKTNRNHA